MRVWVYSFRDEAFGSIGLGLNFKRVSHLSFKAPGSEPYRLAASLFCLRPVALRPASGFQGYIGFMRVLLGTC